MKKLISLLISLTSLVGCASTTTVDKEGRVVVHNFGYVKIIKPPIYPADKNINVTGARLLGFSVGDGFTIGYKTSEYIYMPSDCRVLVVVKDESQLDHMMKEMSLIGEEEICATVSPK